MPSTSVSILTSTNEPQVGLVIVKPPSTASSHGRNEESGRFRGPRRSTQEIRELLIGSALELLASGGLGTGVEHVTFKRVLDHLEASQGVRLTNASIIGRVFASQDEFQSTVLLAALTSTAANETGAIFNQIEPILEAADRSTSESRRAALLEICRVGGQASLDYLSASTSWAMWTAVWSMHMTGSRPDDLGLKDLLCDSYATSGREFSDLYGGLLDYFGFRMKPDYSLSIMTTMLTALVEGSVLRDTVDPGTTRRIIRPTGPAGSEQSWTLFGVGLAAIFSECCEPIDGWTPDTTGSGGG